jgi:T-complex protein 1 subunit alpha
VGDGTTSVVIIASELLKRANELIKKKVHPTNIIAGYKMAAKEACKFLTENMSISVKDVGKEALINAAKTSMSSKIIGPESELFGKLVVESV